MTDQTPTEPAPDRADEIPAEPVPDRTDETPTEPAPDRADQTPAEPVPDRADETPAEPVDGESEPTRTRKGLRSAVEWAVVAVGALVIAVLVRTFLVQAFSIPSESMEPTLNRGDRLLVDKVGYRFGGVQRGDIVVFDSPKGQLVGTDEPLIKRVVGLEGETIELNDGIVIVDGHYMLEHYLDPSTLTLSQGPIPGCVNGGSLNSCTVAEGHIFVLGDNRPSSRDSRFFGPVETETIIGRAWLKYWPLGDIGIL